MRSAVGARSEWPGWARPTPALPVSACLQPPVCRVASLHRPAAAATSPAG